MRDTDSLLPLGARQSGADLVRTGAVLHRTVRSVEVYGDLSRLDVGQEGL